MINAATEAMRRRRPACLVRQLTWAAGLLGLALGAAHATDTCVMVRYRPMHVTMSGTTPLVSVAIDGVKESLILDSGALDSMLTLHTVNRLHLSFYSNPYGAYIEGAGGGRIIPLVASTKSFTLAGTTIPYVQFLVAPAAFSSGAVGLLGQNVLRMVDDEYDLADGVLRFFTPKHCGDRPLAYWATSQAYSVIDLRRTSVLHPHIVASAQLDGRTVTVLFDTGAPRSVVSLRAARSVGITPRSPGVKPEGTLTGIGGGRAKVWLAPFASLTIGDERIFHTQLLIGNAMPSDVDMILGADFFLAHRIYVANSQRKLYFTYNGGPVFVIDSASTPPAPATQRAPVAASVAPAGIRGVTTTTRAASTQGSVPSSTGADAPELLRRALADAARGMDAPASAMLTRAIQLAPKDPRLFYHRALVYRAMGQRSRSLEDLDRALSLDPKYIGAYLARAALRSAQPEVAESDLDTADRLLAPGAGQRLALAISYDRIGEYAAAVHQYDLWLDAHGRDDCMWLTARGGRCGAQAAADLDLSRAARDCRTALEYAPHAASFLASRGLLDLRRDRNARAISEYDAAHKQQPRSAAALYGRGLAELRSGRTAAARTDLAAAKKLKAGVARQFAAMGLAPVGASL